MKSSFLRKKFYFIENSTENIYHIYCVSLSVVSSSKYTITKTHEITIKRIITFDGHASSKLYLVPNKVKLIN